MSRVVIYGRTMCEPCKTLKSMLQDANVPFDEIDITQLPPEEKAVVVENILKVSKIDTATVPAAVVGCGEGVIQWFSNHGSCEVTEMFEEIRAALRT